METLYRSFKKIHLFFSKEMFVSFVFCFLFVSFHVKCQNYYS